MGKNEDMNTYSRKYGKPDVERLGVFIEMPYLKQYYKNRPEYLQGLSMLSGVPKTKCGTQDGYFDKEFKRIFVGERGKKGQGKVIEIKTPFIPTGPAKKHATPGDHFGTFGKPFAEFSPVKRPQKPVDNSKPNPVTNPGKKGGPGYVNITIGKYPIHMGDRGRPPKPPGKMLAGAFVLNHYTKSYFDLNVYKDPKAPTKRYYVKPKEGKLDPKWATRPPFMPTGPAKWMGGCKAGTFTKYPEWKADKYLNALQIQKVLAGKQPPARSPEYSPQSYGEKTMFTDSILRNIKHNVNVMNFKSRKPNYVKYLLKSVY